MKLDNSLLCAQRGKNEIQQHMPHGLGNNRPVKKGEKGGEIWTLFNLFSEDAHMGKGEKTRKKSMSLGDAIK